MFNKQEQNLLGYARLQVGRGSAVVAISLMEAQARTKVGDDDAALQSIEEALSVAAAPPERWELAEVLRMRCSPAKDDIETILINSLEIAGRGVTDLQGTCTRPLAALRFFQPDLFQE